MSSSKIRKIDSECRIFNETWTIKYFVVQVKDKLLCLICKETIAVFKEYNVNRHYTSKHFERYSKYDEELRKNKIDSFKKTLSDQQNIFKRMSNQNISSVRASYHIAKYIADAGRPFTDGEFVKKCVLKIAEEICPEKLNEFRNVSLSANTIMRRIEDIGTSFFSQLKEKAKKFIFFSLALDESTDVSDTAQFLIFIRGINDNFEITEELAALKSLKGTTTGNDIFLKVSEIMVELELNYEKLICITTDGAKNMAGGNIGLIGLINNKCEVLGITKPLHLHCIIHQQVLCAKIFNSKSIMSVVTSTINFIRRHGLNHRQFKQFIKSIDVEHSDILYHSEVRWLTKGKVLKRFFDLRHEIDIFMNEKEKKIAELSDGTWLCTLAFLADITKHINDLNYMLQGKGKLAYLLFYDVKSFEVKLELFRSQLVNKNVVHFQCCTKLLEDQQYKTIFPYAEFEKSIKSLQNEFVVRFSDFKKREFVFNIFLNPFEVEVNTVQPTIQLELIDLQNNDILKETYKEGNLIEFYKNLDANIFPNIKNFAREQISIFGSTYICEQTFSRMKYIKNQFRERLTDSHLEEILRISVSQENMNINDIVNATKSQLHHSH